jgi:hypothetical protein
MPRALAILFVAGCFSPSYPPGEACGPAGWCPPGQGCTVGGVCEPHGAAGGDATAGGDGASPSDAPVITHNIVFVTSTQQLPPTSLAAADDLCVTRAAGRLSGTYVAWLSAEGVDARDRLGSARGWVRPDGLPFADRVADIELGRILYPPRLDELGDNVGIGAQVATGTSPAGVRSAGGSCDSGVGTAYGYADGGTRSWTDTGNIACDQLLRQYCFGIDRALPLVVVPATGRKAFLSPSPWTPAGGLTAADEVCRTAAKGVVTGDFIALLAPQDATAASRFTPGGAPWVRLDGIPFADAELGSATAPLTVTPAMTYLSERVWTGAASATTSGTAGTTCVDWTISMAGSSGAFAVASRSGAAFFNASEQFCNTATATHLYCLER